jgi:acyl-CoA thioester hydrolase
MDSETPGVFRRRRVVSADDLDVLGHVNNAVWVRFVVELAEAHSRAVGLDLRTLRRLGGVWVVQRHEIDYLRPAGPEQEMVEETWVSQMRGARCLRHARFHLAPGDTLLVRATTTWAFVDPESGRPRRLPAEVTRRFPLREGPSLRQLDGARTARSERRS